MQWRGQAQEKGLAGSYKEAVVEKDQAIPAQKLRIALIHGTGESPPLHSDQTC